MGTVHHHQDEQQSEESGIDQAWVNRLPKVSRTLSAGEA